MTDNSKQIDWRELKKELFDNPPKERSNITMNRTDIFGTNY